MPCPKKERGTLYPSPERINQNKTGFCSLPDFRHLVIYNESIKMNIKIPIIDWLVKLKKHMSPSYVIIGRDKVGDISSDSIKSKDDIFSEVFSFPISPKKDLILFSLIISDTGKKEWFYYYETFKTPLKLKSTKVTSLNHLDRNYFYELELIKYIESFIFDMQFKQSSFFEPKSKDYKNYNTLFKLIPSYEELEVFNSDVKLVENYTNFKNYRFQLRD
tara:strand:- start:66 stop:719 length:654 start_codon:yes stop_codon:yes gene_type:complete